MNIWEFAAGNPITALILAYLLMAPVRYAYRAYNRHLRHKNILAHGWPTAPIDADGDVVYPDNDVDEAACRRSEKEARAA